MFRPRPSVVPAHPAVRLGALLLLVLLALAGGSAPARAESATTGPGVVEGTVRDQEGAPVAGARVRVATETYTEGVGGGSYERIAVSDEQGHYRAEGIVLPTGYVTDDGRGFRVERDGYATEGVRGVTPRLKSYDGTPIRVDVVLRRLDVVLRGRLSVRGGASPVGGGVTATLAAPPGGYPGPFDSFSATADADGRYELHVPAGSYGLQASSRYGLESRWPDLPRSRPAPSTRVAAPGETIDGLDISMRPRLQDAAKDEFGDYHEGWDIDPSTGRSARTSSEPYPRDTYRSVTSPNGAAVGLGALRSNKTLLTGLPDDELLTVTGVGLAMDVPIRNTGDDVLWLGDVHVEGEFVLGSSCYDAFDPCAGRYVLPGETKTVSVTVLTYAYAPQYRLRLVVPSDGRADASFPFVQRNIAEPGLAPGAQGTFDPLRQYLPAGAQAAALLLGAPKTTPTATIAGIGAVVVRRSSVRVAFPAAGRVDVAVDRRTAARGRAKARWSSVRTVRLRATRAGTRSARIRPLARGRYRIRATMRIGSGPVRRATALRIVTR